MWEKIKKWVFGLKSGILAFWSLKLRHPNNPQPPSSPPKNIVLRNENGILHGLCVFYWDNGNVWFKERFVNGVLHGLCIYYYYSNGNIWCKQRYVNGKLHGISEYYHDSGKLWLKQYYINGKCVYGERYDDINVIEFDI